MLGWERRGGQGPGLEDRRGSCAPTRRGSSWQWSAQEGEGAGRTVSVGCGCAGNAGRRIGGFWCSGIAREREVRGGRAMDEESPRVMECMRGRRLLGGSQMRLDRGGAYRRRLGLGGMLVREEFRSVLAGTPQIRCSENGYPWVNPSLTPQPDPQPTGLPAPRGLRQREIGRRARMGSSCPLQRGPRYCFVASSYQMSVPISNAVIVHA